MLVIFYVYKKLHEKSEKLTVKDMNDTVNKVQHDSDWTSTSTLSTSTNTRYLKSVLWTLLKYFSLKYICTKYVY
jgi:hypothetical protein